MEIAAIFKMAYSFNAKNGITGCLLYYNTEFLHFIEGKKEFVLTLFKKIKLDSRHIHVTHLYSEEVVSQSFASMYLCQLEEPGSDTSHLPFILKATDLKHIQQSVSNQTTCSRLFWAQVDILLSENR